MGLINLCLFLFPHHQAATVSHLPVHQPGVFSCQSGVRPAGEDVLCRSPHHRAGEGRDQRHTLRPVRHLAGLVSLQDRQDVAGQHLPGVQGEMSCNSKSGRIGAV